MDDERRLRRAFALGVCIAGLGLFCVGGGVAVLTWRLLKPEDAILLPPGDDRPLAMTPTPGLLEHPLVPPPLPTDLDQLVILPVSERPTSTPTIRPTTTPIIPLIAAPSMTPTIIPTMIRCTTAPSPTVPASHTPTITSAPTLPPTFPTGLPQSAIPTTLIPSPTATAEPSPTPMPTATTVPAIPDRIVIDAIGLDAPVVTVGQHALILEGQVYSQWEVPNQRAAGWHQNSASPGRVGNTVLNGHHNIYGEVFHYLIALQPGDIVTLETQGKRYFYIVAQTMTLAEEGQPLETRQANARWILPTEDERVTLITCWPYDANTHRLVVVALPLSALGDTVEIP